MYQSTTSIGWSPTRESPVYEYKSNQIHSRPLPRTLRAESIQNKNKNNLLHIRRGTQKLKIKNLQTKNNRNCTVNKVTKIILRCALNFKQVQKNACLPTLQLRAENSTFSTGFQQVRTRNKKSIPKLVLPGIGPETSTFSAHSANRCRHFNLSFSHYLLFGILLMSDMRLFNNILSTRILTLHASNELFIKQLKVFS